MSLWIRMKRSTGLMTVVLGALALAACGGSPQVELGASAGGTSATQTTAGTTTQVGGTEETAQGDGMEGMGGMAAPEDVPRLPPVKGYYTRAGRSSSRIPRPRTGRRPSC